MQRGHHFAIVDEVDSILIDEGRTPLIISGPAGDQRQVVRRVRRLMPLMKKDVHYEVEEAKRTVAVTEEGVEFVEDEPVRGGQHPAHRLPEQRAQGQELFHRDQQYIVSNGEVLIVDEFTGRVLAGRRYNEGMHQAIEAKEKVKIKDENQTLATITLQNYFRLYEKLSGMTGTAQTEAAELHRPTSWASSPSRPTGRWSRGPLRRHLQDEKAKFEAVVEDIAERNEAGQPVLVGTASVEVQVLSKFLLSRGIPHEVLNAKNHAREAQIVAAAGQLGAVTVATNMAGRGTDIQLGGNPEFIADEALRARGLSPSENAGGVRGRLGRRPRGGQQQVKAEHEEVIETGGSTCWAPSGTRAVGSTTSCVAGPAARATRGVPLLPVARRRPDAPVQRPDARVDDDDAAGARRPAHRIEDGHPGDPVGADPGGAAEPRGPQGRPQVRRGAQPPAHRHLRRASQGARGRRPARAGAFDGRRRHRRLRRRRDRDRVRRGLGSRAAVDLQGALPGRAVDSRARRPRRRGRPDEPHARGAQAGAARRRAPRVRGREARSMRELERRVLLSVLDRKWREHLYEMDYLRAGIHLRAMANRDPVVEYQREGYDMFMAMLDGIKEESVGFLFNLEVKTKEEQEAEAKAKQDEAEAAALAAAQEGTARVLARQAAEAKAAAGNGQGAAAASAAPSARRSGAAKAAAPAAAAAPVVTAPKPSGTGPELAVKGLDEPRRSPEQLQYSAPSLDGSAKELREGRQDGDGVGHEGAGAQRSVPRGSGKKYKFCHGASLGRLGDGSPRPLGGHHLGRLGDGVHVRHGAAHSTAPPPILIGGRGRVRGRVLSRSAGQCSASVRRCPRAGRRRRARGRRAGRPR